ncbi:uncharacterized protein LOC135492859 isoform X2 [Lineus longissimus]|uniref:uncharacterized protein LOC135492859 isoform X2 n=1 Tax=Lineus longissimus TaxID=88925 RepID=UPI00315CEB5A
MTSTATIRSSVRPKSSKQPWGTIMHPEFGMGHQKMTNYEIDQTVTRLYQIPIKDERAVEKPMMKEMSQQGLAQMLARLTAVKKTVTDSNRVQQNSQYANMGIVNSYAWKGYN